MTLLALTRLLDHPVELIRVAGPGGYLLPGHAPGTGLAGRGVALRVSLDGEAIADGDAAADQVSQTLMAIETDDAVMRPGTGPVAVGALPFAPGRPSELVIPQMLVGTDGERSWVTSIAPSGSAAHDFDLTSLVDDVPPPIAPDGFTLTSTVPHEKWCKLIEDTLGRIESGALTKVVLSREVVVEANREIPIVTVLERLRALYPSCHQFLVDGFLGASPELLVARTGRTVRSHPLAGTLAHSGDAQADEKAATQLMGSVKDRWEHGLVVDAVANTLRPHCDHLEVPDAPSIVSLRNVMHLGTELVGSLSDGATALALALSLHPTPAVGGTPTDAAVAWIDEVEGIARRRFAGPVGWVDKAGDGGFVVSIRS
ncbi:MAG: isochorismate synthase, partial [Acidimicrobiales bacterium]